MVGSIGLILAGLRVVRSRTWTGWRSYTPLVAGAYYFVALMPIFIAAGFGNLWAITGWNLCFILLGVALVQRAPATHHEQPDHAG